jgi:hypothetical protein
VIARDVFKFLGRRGWKKRLRDLTTEDMAQQYAGLMDDLFVDLIRSCDVKKADLDLLEQVGRLFLLVQQLKLDWEDGHIAHVEDALGWRRPKKWHRDAARKKATHFAKVVLKVEQLRACGFKTPGVFAKVAEEFPVSESQVGKWYYEFRNSDWSVIEQELRAIPAKTRRT